MIGSNKLEELIKQIAIQESSSLRRTRIVYPGTKGKIIDDHTRLVIPIPVAGDGTVGGLGPTITGE